MGNDDLFRGMSDAELAGYGDSQVRPRSPGELRGEELDLVRKLRERLEQHEYGAVSDEELHVYVVDLLARADNTSFDRFVRMFINGIEEGDV